MRKPQKVLYVLPNAELGGAEKFTFDIISRHDRTRYQPVLLFLNAGSLMARAERLEVPAYTLPHRLRLSNPASVVRAIRECSRLVEIEKINLIHSCMAYAHVIGGVTASRRNIPSCLFQHGPVGGVLDVVAPTIPVQHIITNSQYTASRQKKLSLTQRPISVLRYGMETPSLTREKLFEDELSVKYGLPAKAIVMVIIARLDPWKGIHMAIEASAAIMKKDPRVKLLVVGGPFRHFHPDYLPQLKALVARLGVEGSVCFTGFQSDVTPFLIRADLLIHAATSPEPFGLAILEAMAYGKAVIASRGGGVPEIVTDGEDGLLHTPGDIGELAEKIKKLVDNDSYRESLGAGARRTVTEKFSPASMMDSLERLYDSLLGRTDAG